LHPFAKNRKHLRIIRAGKIVPNARHPKFVYKIDHVQRAAKALFRRHPPRSLDFFPKINIHFGFSNRRQATLRGI